MHTGLTKAEAKKRLAQFGSNEIVQGKKLSGLVAFLSRFANPLILILLAAALISAFLGDPISAVIIIAIVVLSILLDFINTHKSERAAGRLRAQVMVMASVLRDGVIMEISHADIVPGDIVTLTPGDMIPADCKVLESKSFFINESSLTGESFPVEKQPNSEVFMGSSVTVGDAMVEVVATGKNTKFSHIAESLIQKESPTEFDRSMKDFSFLIMKATFALVIFIFLINALTKHDVLESFLFAAALAVGLTPELLPLIITLNLTKGSLELAKRGIIVKKLSAIQNFGSMDILCTDKTGTLTEDRIVLVKHIDGQGNDSDEVFLHSYISSVFRDSYHNPLDMAVKEYKTLDISSYSKIDEIPFDYQRKMDTAVVQKSGSVMLISKGTPDHVLNICTHYGNMNTVLGDALREDIIKKYEELSREGFRVLGIANKPVLKKNDYDKNDENEMIFLGFIAFLDPAKASVTDTLKRLEEYGIEIKVLTGDNEWVSQKIADDIQLAVKGVLTGSEIEKMSDEELRVKAEETTIFARISPDQKKRLVVILQSSHVVGFVGDGINDAPSLRAADVGISVNNAVDVAKESADLILMNKSLADLVQGVVDGRKTFTNTLKYLMMELSSNFGNMFSMAGASIFLPFLPMLPTQILLNNLIYDASQFSIPLDNVDEQSIQKPIRFNIGFIKKFMLIFGPVSSIFDFTTFFILYSVFRFSEHAFQTGWFLESLITQSLVIFLIRTKKLPFLESVPSITVGVSMILAILIGWSVTFLPIGKFFGFVPLSGATLLIISIIAGLYLVVVEFSKRWFYRKIQAVVL